MSSRRPVRFDIRQAGRQILLVLAVLAVLNIVFFMIYTGPRVREYNGLRNQNAPVFEALKEREAYVDDLESFRDAVLKAESDLQQVRDEILSTRDRRMVDVQAEVARIAQDFQIPVDSVRYGPEILIDEELDRLGIDVPLEGGYVALRKFLHAVENSDKFLLVERVALSRGKDGGVLLALNIGMATYFNAPEELIQRKRQGVKRGRRNRT